MLERQNLNLNQSYVFISTICITFLQPEIISEYYFFKINFFYFTLFQILKGGNFKHAFAVQSLVQKKI
jgi:hypothetical protein